MICPNCESDNCRFISQAHTKSGSFCDGCCGFLLLGPIGVLCGFCGSETQVKEFWVCDNCGCKFQCGLERVKIEKKVDAEKGNDTGKNEQN